MNWLSKIRLAYQIVKAPLKRALAVKMLERQLNATGHDIHIDYNCNVIDSKFGKQVRLYGPSRIAKSFVDDFSYIQSYCNISNTHIGKFCSIGSHVIIAHGEHPTNFLATHPIFFSENSPWANITFAHKRVFQQHSPVNIGHDVWIGANVYIRDGVSIGTGAIIATGAVITKDVPPYAIVGGVPAKIIKMRYDETIVNGLLASCWWEYNTDTLLKLKHFFVAPFTHKMVEDFILELKKTTSN